MRIAALAFALAITASACASSGTAASDQQATATTTTRRTNVITAQEIRESAAPSLPDLIRQLRPGWPTNVTIVVNNDVMGGYDMLRQQPKSTAAEIRYLTRSEAQMKWGMRVQEVIQVITR
ncbi:MAG TPA: hypothetical protein VFZ73_09025, partial [Gemmatimonadaceae bacterium]